MEKHNFRSMIATASLVLGLSGVGSAAAPVQTASWTPHPINPQLCNNQEGPPSKPPEPGGHCDIEVRLTNLEFTNGQGASEGKGEIRGLFFAEPQDVPAGSETVVAVSPSQDYSAGQGQGMNLDLGTYRVAVGDTRDIEICASIVEADNGGFNGGDDYAKPCTVITLSCNAQTGQPSFFPQLGPEPLCESDKSCNGSVTAFISVMAADADMDTIPNDDDFTPELCDEELKGTEGIGLLLYFHYDDNGLITLGQSLWTNLSQIYSAYDYVVLVADNETSNPGNFSAAAWRNADAVFPPTRDGLMAAMRDLTSKGYRFDTFVHAHGYKNGSTDSEFESMDPCVYDPVTMKCEPVRISGDWLLGATHQDLIGTARGGIPIVAWWSTTCIAERQIDTWLEIGAITASGAEDVQFFPNTWGNFVTAWIGGQTYKRSVDDSLTAGVINQATSLINIQGAAPPWNCNQVGNLVVEKNLCAENFFNDIDDDTDGDGPDTDTDDAAYNIEEVYDTNESGYVNMLISSTRTFLGSTLITFGAVNHTWP
jgi:hypothetical protein